jgi:tetratricopeptide (TPR) repeat protein
MASALIELELKRYDNAEATLLSLIALQQRVDEAWYYLGRTRQAAGRSDDAIDAYENVGAIQEFVDAKRRAADLLRGTEDEVAVSQFFVEQRTRFQDQAERLYLVEAELQREAAPEAAIATYTQALSEYPASLSLLYGRAMLFEAEGDIAAMETDLRAILAEDPDNATTLNALGYTLTNNTTRYDEAAQLIERALELNPREPAMLDSLGWVYFKMGRFIEAENILREAYELLPDPEVAAHLGETLWSQGKRLEAKDIWRSGLGRDANNVHIRSTLNRLGVALD